MERITLEQARLNAINGLGRLYKDEIAELKADNKALMLYLALSWIVLIGLNLWAAISS